MNGAARRGRRDLRTLALYTWALLKEFRFTLYAIVGAVLIGGALYAITPSAALGGRRPSPFVACYAAWMSLFGEPFSQPDAWYIAVVQGVYPLVGFIVIGEGIARFALLMISRRRGQKEWMKVMASTYRDHIVLCGLGHLGFRVLGALIARKTDVVAIEKDEGGKFITAVRATGIPLLIRDVKEDEALIEAGVKHARAIVIATNDDMINMEVAIDARRLNPDIKVVMRLFDQQLASKLQHAFRLDYAFSSSALAAPAVAAMTLDCKILSAFELAGTPYVVAEVPVDEGSALAGRTVAEVEAAHAVRLLCRTPREGAAEAPPSGQVTIARGDLLAIHIEAERISSLVAAGRAA